MLFRGQVCEIVKVGIKRTATFRTPKANGFRMHVLQMQLILPVIVKLSLLIFTTGQKILVAPNNSDRGINKLGSICELGGEAFPAAANRADVADSASSS